MRPDDLILRGYTVPDGDSYFAICLDLNIYARGDSVEEATEKCVQFVGEYINEAISDDVEHASHLLRRRTPLKFWALYRFMQVAIVISRLLRGSRGKPRRGGPFETPLPIRVGC